MKTGKGLALVLVIAMGTWACPAQETALPTEPLPSAPSASASVTLTASNSSDGMMPGVERGSPLIVNNLNGLHRAPVMTGRVVDRNFLLINGLHVATAILDVELTQSCIASHSCKEGNPMMPSSQAGQLAVSFAFVSYGAGIGYWLKKHGSRMWWLAPTAGTASHIAGAATGLAHQ